MIKAIYMGSFLFVFRFTDYAYIDHIYFTLTKKNIRKKNKTHNRRFISVGEKTYVNCYRNQTSTVVYDRKRP